MPPCGYVVMRMSPWCMLWCKCLLGACYDANVYLDMQWMQLPSCRYAMNANALLWVCHDVNVRLRLCHDVNVHMMQTQFIQKFLLFSKRDFHNAWNQNLLKAWFIKKLSSFWLKAPKKLVITIRNLRMGHWFRIWWSGSKDLFSQFSWAKRWCISKAFFLEKWIIWNQAS